VDWRNDAHPVFAVKLGENYRYFSKLPTGQALISTIPTASPLNRGLVGLVYVETEKSRLGFRHRVNDITLMLQDRWGPHTTLPPWTSWRVF
jgi:hypothetical protein